jgi:cytochrome c-type biogenesis protein CcmH
MTCRVRHRCRTANREVTDMTEDPNQLRTRLRTQLRALRARFEGGEIGATQFEIDRAALRRRIIEAAIAGLPETRAPAPRSPDAALWLAALLVSIGLALAGTLWVGFSAAGDPRWTTAPPDDRAAGVAGTSAQAMSPETLELAAARLVQRLQQQPEDPEGWALLGRTQAALGRQALAAQAFAKAVELRPGDVAALLDHVDALALANAHRLEGAPARLIERALELDPDNAKALALAGTLAWQRGDDATALQCWDRVVQIGPADDPLVLLARDSAAELRSRSGRAAGSTAPRRL